MCLLGKGRSDRHPSEEGRRQPEGIKASGAVSTGAAHDAAGGGRENEPANRDGTRVVSEDGEELYGEYVQKVADRAAGTSRSPLYGRSQVGRPPVCVSWEMVRSPIAPIERRI